MVSKWLCFCVFSAVTTSTPTVFVDATESAGSPCATVEKPVCEPRRPGFLPVPVFNKKRPVSAALGHAPDDAENCKRCVSLHLFLVKP